MKGNSRNKLGLSLPVLFSLLWINTTFASPLPVSQPLYVGNGVNILKRDISADASCPDGWLCIQGMCPSGVVCATGTQCINFEGNLACVPYASQWCALNPSSYQGVGCWSGMCCHGQCYASDAVCCDNSPASCNLGTRCNVCQPGEQCGEAANSCISSTTRPITIEPSTTASSPPSITTEPPLSSTTNGNGGIIIIPSSSNPSSSGGGIIIITSSASVPSSSSTATPPMPSGPILVPYIGNFGRAQDCYVDSATERVLRGDTIVDLTVGTGMTVDKCVEFAEEGGWRFAGVEYSGECFVGNTLRSISIGEPGECDMPCAGNPLQLCGGGNRIQIYEDSTWFNPTADQLVRELEEWADKMLAYKEAIQDYKDAAEELQAAVDAGATTSSNMLRRLTRRQGLSQVQVGSRVWNAEHDLRRAADVVLARGDECNTNREMTRRQLIQAINRDIEPTGGWESLMSEENFELFESDGSDPFIDAMETMMDNAQAARAFLDRTLQSLTLPILGPAGLNLPTHLAATVSVLTIIGAAKILEEAASGLFSVIDWLIDLLRPEEGGGGQDPDPEPEPEPSTSSSSTSSCTEAPLPTDVMVVAKRETTQAQFRNLMVQLKKEPDVAISDVVNMAGDAIGRAFLADMDGCTARELLENDLIDTVSLNARGFFADDARHRSKKQSYTRRSGGGSGTSSMKRSLGNKLNSPKNSTSGHNSKRTITEAELANYKMLQGVEFTVPGDDNKYIQPAPHLDWITALWAQRGYSSPTGHALDIPNYLYTPPPPTTDETRFKLYIMDSGIKGSHFEFDQNRHLLDWYDTTQPGQAAITTSNGNILTCTDPVGHGTEMSSCAVGQLAGTAKNRRMTMVKMVDAEGDLSAWGVWRGFQAILHDKNRLGLATAAVSMSWGFVLKNLNIDPDAGDYYSKLTGHDFFLSALHRLRANNIVGVIAAGNSEKLLLQNVVPHRWGGRDNTNTIVVGGCGLDGNRLDWSTYLDGEFSPEDDVLSMLMVAEGVVAADPSGGDHDYISSEGTSHAAALVAGLVALKLEEGAVAWDEVKSHLRDEGFRLKGRNWEVDDPGHGVHPRVALDLLTPCEPDGDATDVAAPSNFVMEGLTMLSLETTVIGPGGFQPKCARIPWNQPLA